MVTAMPKVIEFFVPEKFGKQSGKSIHLEQRGKMISFRVAAKKSA
jgi:hypothetical protein